MSEHETTDPAWIGDWPAGCQRPAKCKAQRTCSYQLTPIDHAAQRLGVFITNPCPHRNTVGIWEMTHG